MTKFLGFLLVLAVTAIAVYLTREATDDEFGLDFYDKDDRDV